MNAEEGGRLGPSWKEPPPQENFLPGCGKSTKRGSVGSSQSAPECTVGVRAGSLLCQRAAASGKGVGVMADSQVSLENLQKFLMWGGARVCVSNTQKTSSQNTRSLFNWPCPFTPCPSSPSWPCRTRGSTGSGVGRVTGRTRWTKAKEKTAAHYRA